MSPLEAKLAQVQALMSQGRWKDAAAIAQRLYQSAPADPRVCHALSVIHEQLDETSRALYFAERTAQLLPGDAAARQRHAHLLLASGKLREAEAQARRAVALDPRHPGARATLAIVLSSLGREAEAVEACDIDGEIPLDDPTLAVVAGGALVASAQPGRGVEVLREALAKHPASLPTADALCMALHYVPDATRDAIADAHRVFGRLLEPAGPRPKPAIIDPNPDRPLRVGLVSPDLRSHPVGRFMLPLFERHDPAATRLIVFDTSVGTPDPFADRLRRHATEWHAIGTITWTDFEARVRASAIDVLIDLSGHTRFNCLELFACRPAPVQATYAGYPDTTGLASIDYRVVDSATDPPGAEAFATERLARLEPCFLCYTLPEDLPPVADPPCLSAGHVTFGSFNAAPKLSAPLLRLWARVLDAVPGSRLLVKALAFREPRLRERIAAMALDAGIAPDRLTLASPQDLPGDHLVQYARLDVALDPFPYHGTTTTCEALAMGVPVVSLAGDRHASRVGASLLAAAGLPELVARSEDEYVEIAAGLARDRARLASLRASLRDRVRTSALGNAPAFAQRFESMIRGWWREACAR